VLWSFLLFDLVVDDALASANSRITGIRLSGLTLRWMENWRRNVGDYHSAMILLAVVAITSSRLLRTELDPELRDMRNPVPEPLLASCNISSLAAATGLSRETTRRKVNELVERGYLVRDEDRKVRFRPGYLQDDRAVELVRKQLDCFAQVAVELVRDGVLKL